MKRVWSTLLIGLLFFMSGCMDNTEKKAMEQSELAMEKGDYTAALNYIKLAQNEGNKNEETVEKAAILENFLRAKEEFAQSRLIQAEEALDAIPDTYNKYKIASDIDDLRRSLDSKMAVSSNVYVQISAVRKWIASGDYASAKLNISELYTKELDKAQRAQVDELKSILNTAQSKINEAGTVAETAAVASNTDVVDTYYVVNCNEWITLRSSPSTSATSLARMPLGQAVGFIENVGNGFCKVNYDGVVGYALAAYLSDTRPGYVQRRSAQVVNCKEWITLRSEPSISARSLAHIPLGAYVTFLGTASNGFYHIEYNGYRGYGLQSYLELR